MKAKLLTLAAATLLNGHAKTNEDVTINCNYKQQPLFGIFIKSGPFEGVFNKTVTADVTIGGPRLYLPYSTTLHKTPIRTRTIIGVGYYAELGENSSIRLTDIHWVPEGWAQEVGFTGVYIHDGHETALVCE